MAPPVSSTSPVVLIVEDEFLIRMHAAAMVEDAGYIAVIAQDAEAAIKILENREDVRVVFTDINLNSSIDGLRLARLIRDRWPPIELIVTSAHSVPAAGELPERSRFLPKPYSAAQIAHSLDELTLGGV